MTSVYFNTSPYIEIISGINTIFSFSDGVVKLTGSRGTGKSALLRELADELRGEGMEVLIFDSLPKSAEEMQNYLIRKLELPADISFRKALLRHLHVRPRDRQRLILVLDNAELIDVETLKSISSLRRLENDSQCFVNVLLCGEPALDKLLADPELTELSADISMQYQLQALDLHELGKFCGCYLNYIGKGHYQLSAEHLDMLQRDSQGLPGQVLEHLGEHLTDPTFLLSLNRPEAVAFKPSAKLANEPKPSWLDNIRTLMAEGYRDWLKLLSGAAVTLTIASVLYGTSGYWSPFLAGSTPVSEPTTTLLPSPAQPVPSDTAVEAESEPAVQVTPEQPPPRPTPVDNAPAPQATPAPAPVIEAPVATNPPATAATIAAADTAAAAAPPVALPVVAPSVSPPASPAVAPPAAEAVSRQTAIAATPAVTIPTTATNNAAVDSASLRARVDSWAAAWQRQDVEDYLAAYHSDFTPQYHNSLSSWRNDRTRSLTRPSSITITITDFEIAATGAEGTTVRFWQEYRSPTYADRTQKELVFSRDQDGELHILRELNREVVKLPSGRVTATAPPAARAATAPATPTPTATLSGAEIVSNGDSISQFVSSWLDAWQGKDVAAYLGHYHPDYQPDAATSTAAWRSERALKINRPRFIQLQLEALEIVEQDATGALIRLRLEYRSNYYADRTTKLVRVQRQPDGNLQIIMERNTLVETLTLSRLAPRPPKLARAFGRAIIEHTF